jgi:hypothetical protein
MTDGIERQERLRRWADRYEPPPCARPSCGHLRYVHAPMYCAVLGCKCDGYAINGTAVEVSEAGSYAGSDDGIRTDTYAPEPKTISESEARALDGNR